jgi:hypothetical protein
MLRLERGVVPPRSVVSAELGLMGSTKGTGLACCDMVHDRYRKGGDR